ncbi:uncharacterized protein A4U43_UnF8210 [Asparagus officinalis]|uniref:serine C-palmitoyltransferase n=1 Tax=Asparagus officinalis TaxID=4686 RepID=A0A1R3L618_ASPOF|nr:uncharacterized protein A4U43_UnF8210 [Asparagus officinalis]
MDSSVMNMTAAGLDWVSAKINAPMARAVVFGVHIDGHLVVEVLLVVVILFQLSRKSYKPPKKPLTEKEIDDLCDEWVPEPLHPPITEEMDADPSILESAAGPHTIVDGKEVVNFASGNYLGLLGNEKINDSCIASLEKYGVGSCGPRGFYGTIGTPDAVLYSYGILTIFSVIPAFAKKGDIIVADEGVNWAVQNGLHLSRSTVVYFKHNDMASPANTLEKNSGKVAPLDEIVRLKEKYRFRVQNSGKVAPLDEIVRLKEKYRFRVILDESNSFGVLGNSGRGLARFRVILDESNSFGVLGNSGRGLAEHYGVLIEKIDIITAGMGNALATDGGFCTGVDRLEENPSVLASLRNNIALLRKGLSDVPGLTLTSNPESPIVLLQLKKPTGSHESDLKLLEKIVDRVLNEDSVFLVSTKRSKLDKCRLPVGSRMLVSVGHSESDLMKASESLKRVAAPVLSKVA